MRTHKFKYKFNNSIYITGAGAFFIAIFGVLFSLSRLLSLFNMTSFFIILDIISLSVSFLVCVVIVLIFITSKYTITSERLVLSMLLFNQIIPINSIELIREDMDTHKMCVYFALSCDSDRYNFIPINITAISNEEFIKKLRAANPSIVYQPFDKSDYINN